MFTEIATRRVFEEALAQITNAIRLGDLTVGDRLPSEREMAAQMSISRPTLREAIKVLRNAGIIAVQRGGGMYVATEEVPSDLVEERARLRISEIVEVLEARRLLEPRVAQLASREPRPQDLEAMRRAIDLQATAGDDRDRFLHYEIAFHLAMARAARNSVIESLMRPILAKLESVMDMVLLGHDVKQTIIMHEATLDAIRGGDPEEIDQVMDEHLAMLERVWEAESKGMKPRLIASQVWASDGSVGRTGWNAEEPFEAVRGLRRRGPEIMSRVSGEARPSDSA